MDERDPGADTEMFQAFVERREDAAAAPAAAGGNQRVAIAVAVAVVVVLLGVVLAVL